MSGLPSLAELLTVGPRLTGADQGSFFVVRVVTHMSQLPYPPGRLDSKKRDRPSAEILGPLSPAELLTNAPRLTVVSQGSETVGRLVIHRSPTPDPPDRLDWK